VYAVVGLYDREGHEGIEGVEVVAVKDGDENSAPL
jgi:hypothetical protein